MKRKAPYSEISSDYDIGFFYWGDYKFSAPFPATKAGLRFNGVLENKIKLMPFPTP